MTKIVDGPITAEQARELWAYDPLTGLLTWRKRAGGKAKAGQPAGSLVRNHKVIRPGGRRYTYHRVVWLIVHGKWPNGVIDHINGDFYDNRLVNLRDVTPSINGQNQRRAMKTSKTGLLGVHPHLGKFQAQITVRENGRRIVKHLGVFDTAEEGHNAYLIAKRRLHEGCTI